MQLGSKSFLNLFILTFSFSFWTYSCQISTCIRSVQHVTKLGAYCKQVCHGSETQVVVYIHGTVAYLVGHGYVHITLQISGIKKKQHK